MRKEIREMMEQRPMVAIPERVVAKASGKRTSVIDQPRPLSPNLCPLHNYNYVAMPRQPGEPSFGYREKCPLATCYHGIYER